MSNQSFPDEYSLVTLAMPGLFSEHVLTGLAACQKPRVVVVPAPPMAPSYLTNPQPTMLIQPNGLLQWASQHGIPVLHLAQWRDLEPYLTATTILVTACFTRRVPPWVRQMVYRAINVHPSLLPALRGPDPLFYVARGDSPAGVTIHEMTHEFDSGAVLWQSELSWDGVLDEADLIRVHAQQAACGLRQLWQAAEAPRWPATPQATDGVSSARPPHAFAYTLHPEWSMHRVRQFVAGTSLRQHPYFVPQQRCWVTRLDTGTIPVECADGVLYAQELRQ
jgi:methionyl-tRNA formyltransferase